MREAELQSLADWLPQQRWFAAKGEKIQRVRRVDRAELPRSGGAAWWLVEVTGASGRSGLYQMPVAESADPPACWNGLSEAEQRRRWLRLLLAGERIPTEHGGLIFEALSQEPALVAAGDSKLGSAEQSNTSILYQDAKGAPRWVLKLFRRVMAGENPEYEIPQALLAHSRYRNVPPPAGRVLYRGPEGEITLATLQAFIANRGDGWAYVLERLKQNPSPTLLQQEITHWGRRTAELHLALAGIPGPEFAPEPITAADGERWRERARAGAAIERLQPYDALLAPWRQRLNSPASAVPAAGCAKIRIHGDFHLGQMLVTEDDIYIFDFEGEPARPIAERRRKGCVLQDVAGMLRSFSYAAKAAERPKWEVGARAAFLDGYGRALAAGPRPGLPLVPADPEEFQAALDFFECEKAVYELNYELAHRPDWVDVPLSGLRRLFRTD